MIAFNTTAERQAAVAVGRGVLSSYFDLKK
jgi:hypothetical protein